MIDPEARIELLREHATDPRVAAIILDVVLGYGSNADPAGILAPVCESVMDDGGPQIVAYVLGTERDPQGLSDQRARLVESGCIVTETAARASLAAAAVATGDASLLTSTCDYAARPIRAAACGLAELFDQAAWRCGPYVVVGRGDGAERQAGTHRLARRPREGLLPTGACSVLPGHAVSPGRHLGGARVRVD